jgi:hypothetical protein
MQRRALLRVTGELHSDALESRRKPSQSASKRSNSTRNRGVERETGLGGSGPLRLEEIADGVSRR